MEHPASEFSLIISKTKIYFSINYYQGVTIKALPSNSNKIQYKALLTDQKLQKELKQKFTSVARLYSFFQLDAVQSQFKYVQHQHGATLFFINDQKSIHEIELQPHIQKQEESKNFQNSTIQNLLFEIKQSSEINKKLQEKIKNLNEELNQRAKKFQEMTIICSQAVRKNAQDKKVFTETIEMISKIEQLGIDIEKNQKSTILQQMKELYEIIKKKTIQVSKLGQQNNQLRKKLEEKEKQSLERVIIVDETQVEIKMDLAINSKVLVSKKELFNLKQIPQAEDEKQIKEAICRKIKCCCFCASTQEFIQKFEIPQQIKQKPIQKKLIQQEKIFLNKKIDELKQNQFIELINNYQIFPNLETIDLRNNKMTNTGIKVLAQNGLKYSHLNKINLSNYIKRNNQITDQGLKILLENSSKFSNLRIIELGWNQITDVGLDIMSKNDFKLLNLQQINLFNNKITDQGLKILVKNGAKMPKLKSIGFGNNQISDKGIKVFLENSINLPNLQNIDLGRNKISDKGFIFLVENGSKLLNLQSIMLQNNKITGQGLKALVENDSKLPNLKTINLENNTITIQGLKAFLKNSFKWPNLQIINLGLNKLTDQGLKCLVQNGSKLPNLQAIYLFGNQITNQGLKVLVQNSMRLPNLQNINLNGNKISDQGLKILVENRSKFPNLKNIDLQRKQIILKDSSGWATQQKYTFKINL